ncbi:ubiquitin-conjugating enzyme E2 S-B [Mucor lusitanicus]
MTAATLSSKAIKRIVKEIQQLQTSPPEDIQIIVDDENLTEVQAWIRGPDGTPYEGGYFKVKLQMDEGLFLTKIFHPNVSEKGEICVNTLKKDWKSELGIEHVLLTIKCLLIVPNPESALNEEAGKLLLEHYEDYAKRAKLYTSIQATSGKGDYMALTQDQSSSVLKPLSNTSPVSPIISNKKRPQEQQENIKQEQPQSKKAKIKKNDKKKALRRL